MVDDKGVQENNNQIHNEEHNHDLKTRRVQIVDEFGNYNSVQYPIPTDGDSVYYKDICPDCSDIGNFSGEIFDLFDSLHTIIEDTTSNNPKTLKVYFKRSIRTNAIGVGCDDADKSFSNIVVKALGSADEVRYTNDTYEDDDTKRTSLLIPTIPLALNGILIEFHTSDAICLSNLIIYKSIDTISQLQGASEITDLTENVKTYKNRLYVQTGTENELGIGRLFYRENGDETTFAVEASRGDYIITVDDSTGFTEGEYLLIRCPNSDNVVKCFENSEVRIVAIDGDDITIDTPLSSDYDIGTEVIGIDVNMSETAGSLAEPVLYRLKPYDTGDMFSIWSIYKVTLNITDNQEADDSKFGGISALTNGCVIRVLDGETGELRNIANIKNNRDFRLFFSNLSYSDKAGGGNYGVNGTWNFINSEFRVRLDGRIGDEIELLVQDDITDLVDFRIRLQGNIFGG